MIEFHPEPHVGLIAQEHGHDPEDSLTSAQTLIAEHYPDETPLGLRKLLPPIEALQEAWWAGPEVGFTTSEHPDAQPVTVVNLSQTMLSKLLGEPDPRALATADELRELFAALTAPAQEGRGYADAHPTAG